MTDELNTTAHSPVVLNAFNELCSRAYSDWRIHKAIFSDNPRRMELEKSIAGHGLEHSSILSQESILLQIAKLHDPAVQQGHVTLGVEYMVMPRKPSSSRHPLRITSRRRSACRQWLQLENQTAVESLLIQPLFVLFGDLRRPQAPRQAKARDKEFAQAA